MPYAIEARGVGKRYRLGAVNQLCRRTLLVDHGRLARDGAMRDVIDAYLSSGEGHEAEAEFPLDPGRPAQVARIEGVRVFHSVCANVLKSYTEFHPQQPTRIVARFPGECLSEGRYICTARLNAPGDSGSYHVVRSPTFRFSALEEEPSFIGYRKEQGFRALLRLPVAWTVIQE